MDEIVIKHGDRVVLEHEGVRYLCKVTFVDRWRQAGFNGKMNLAVGVFVEGLEEKPEPEKLRFSNPGIDCNNCWNRTTDCRSISER